MAIFSSTTLVRTISLVHLTAAYFLLTQPSALTQQNLLLVLGEAMQIPHIALPTPPSQLTALTAFILTLLSLSDLATTALPAGTSLAYWRIVNPQRLFFLFSLTTYIYLTKPGGAFGAAVSDSSSATSPNMLLRSAGRGAGEEGWVVGLAHLRNSTVFGVAFLESVYWYYVFLTVRDERGVFEEGEAKRREREEEERRERWSKGY